MAKVSGPLFSLEASGRLESLVYDRRGFVRRFVPPANPETAMQGNVRQRLLAAQRAISKIAAATRNQLKTVFVTLGLPGYRWNAYTLQAVIGTGGEAWVDARSTFNAWQESDRQSWNDQAQSIGLDSVSVAYASDSPVAPGMAWFAVCRAVFALGVHSDLGTPDASNAQAWTNALTS